MNTRAETVQSCCFGFESPGQPAPTLKAGIAAAVDFCGNMPTLLVADLAAWGRNPGRLLRDVSRRASEHAHRRLVDPEGEPLDACSFIHVDEHGKFDHWDPVFQRYQPLLYPGYAPRSLIAFRHALGARANALLQALWQHGAQF